VEAVENTSTVVMPVVRGNKKGNQSQMRRQDMASDSVGHGSERDNAGKA
jgi:hypothetical protein